MIVTATKTAYDETKHRALLDKVNPTVGVDLLIGRVQRDLISLFEVHADGLLLGIFISKVDALVNGSRELVVLHGSAVEKPAVGFMTILDPILTKVAQDHGLQSIRVHSDKKGIDRVLTDHNYAFQEAIYRKVI